MNINEIGGGEFVGMKLMLFMISTTQFLEMTLTMQKHFTKLKLVVNTDDLNDNCFVYQLFQSILDMYFTTRYNASRET